MATVEKLPKRLVSKRSEHEFKRLIEDAVVRAFGLSNRGLWLRVDRIETTGHPLETIRVWATLHFLPAGSPFCCGEPECHLGLHTSGRADDIGDHVRRAMGCRQPVVIDFGDRIGVNYHDGVRFSANH